MRKLSLSLLLPFIELTVSISILKLYMGAAQYLARVLWFVALGPAFPLLDIFLPHHILALLPRDFILISGAALAWYFIGRKLDDTYRPRKQSQSKPLAKNILAILFLFFWGIRLIFIGLTFVIPALPTEHASSNQITGGVILWIWAAVLIFAPTWTFAKTTWRKESETFSDI
jgi:hypothetical protein